MQKQIQRVKHPISHMTVLQSFFLRIRKEVGGNAVCWRKCWIRIQEIQFVILADQCCGLGQVTVVTLGRLHASPK